MEFTPDARARAAIPSSLALAALLARYGDREQELSLRYEIMDAAIDKVGLENPLSSRAAIDLIVAFRAAGRSEEASEVAGEWTDMELEEPAHAARIRELLR